MFGLAIVGVERAADDCFVIILQRDGVDGCAVVDARARIEAGVHRATGGKAHDATAQKAAIRLKVASQENLLIASKRERINNRARIDSRRSGIKRVEITTRSQPGNTFAV